MSSFWRWHEVLVTGLFEIELRFRCCYWMVYKQDVASVFFGEKFQPFDRFCFIGIRSIDGVVWRQCLV